MWHRTLTGYLIGVVVVLLILNGVAWNAQWPKQHDFGVFSAGFALGALGMYIAAWLYGYARLQ